jgi:hypothetical protein
VQHENRVCFKHLLHLPRGMSRGAIHAQDQRRAVQLEVLQEHAHDERGIVVLTARERSAITCR